MPLQLRFPICPNLTGRELWLNATLDFCKPPTSFLNFKVCTPRYHRHHQSNTQRFLNCKQSSPISTIELHCALCISTESARLRQTVRLIPLCSGLSETNVCISRFSICINLTLTSLTYNDSDCTSSCLHIGSESPLCHASKHFIWINLTRDTSQLSHPQWPAQTCHQALPLLQQVKIRVVTGITVAVTLGAARVANGESLAFFLEMRHPSISCLSSLSTHFHTS